MAQKIITYQQKNFEISYCLVNHQSKKTMLFLHGWGSNKELMQLAFKNHFKDFNHIYVDLPGFGKSFNDRALITQDYANIIEIFLKEISVSPNIVVGHSFGGKIAILLDYEIILLSTAGILEPKSIKVKFKIFLAKLLKILRLKGSFLRSEDANHLNEGMYQTFKNVVNEDFSPIFSHFNNQATIFWGIDDQATSLESGKKISKLIKKCRFFTLEGDHYFFLKQGSEIEKLYYES